jgi:chromosomal replication initiation ATPase DnaA
MARREKMFGKRRTVRIEDIQEAVCAVWGVNKVDMLSNRRSAHLVLPRHVAMFLSKEMTGRSLPDIGRMFSDRDHTTVLHAVRRITGLRPNDAGLDAMIAKVEAMFASITNPEDAPCSSPQTTAQ